MCVPIFKCILVPYAPLPCSIPEVKLAWRGAAKSSSCPPKKWGGQAVLHYFLFFSPKLSKGKKKHRDVSHIFWTQADGFRKLSGTTASPGPWKPLITPLTLWTSEHCDIRSPHREATLNIPPSLTLHPFCLLSGSGWGLKTLILRPTFWLSWFPLHYP